MKTGEQEEDIAVGFDNLLHAAVFPKFIPISQFDVGITCFIIVLQGGKIQVLVFQEIIVGVPYAAVTVTD